VPDLVVLRALGLGDLLTAVPALRALAAAFPGHRRVLAAPADLRDLALLTGAVDEVVDTAPLRPLNARLHGSDVAVNLHGRGPQSHGVLLEARPRRLIAFAHAGVPESDGSPAWRADEHEVARWCRLLTELGIPADPTSIELERPRVAPPPAARDATVVHPGAASAARRWPVERYAAVARAEAGAGRRVVITGSAAEVELAQDLARRAGLRDDAVYAGRTTLLELAALVAASGRVVCGDTGVAHLATAYGTPSVVLFGPTSPLHWGPPPDRPSHRALWAGHRGDPHAAEPDAGLLALAVDDVLEALDDLDRLEVAA
jgi:ADP-heptose:LPS heptosyltransferase